MLKSLVMILLLVTTKIQNPGTKTEAPKADLYTRRNPKFLDPLDGTPADNESSRPPSGADSLRPSPWPRVVTDFKCGPGIALASKAERPGAVLPLQNKRSFDNHQDSGSFGEPQAAGQRSGSGGPLRGGLVVQA